MPTLPSEPHRYRAVAESFGVDADRYDRARPRYPDALLERIVAAAPGPAVLDVGTGTGIVARQLCERGCHVLGVDVDARMADVARRHGVDVEVAAFESWDPAGRAFDAVVSGQTWHWIDPVAGAAQAARVLRPGGPLVLFWNALHVPPELGAAFGEVFRRVLPDSIASRAWPTSVAGAYDTMTALAADGIRQAAAFEEPERSRFPWEREYSTQEWLDVVPTFGGNSLLPAAATEELLAGVGAAVDAVGGRFTMASETVALTAVRRPAC
jgi:SAM-dependent methyltransferase